MLECHFILAHAFSEVSATFVSFIFPRLQRRRHSTPSGRRSFSVAFGMSFHPPQPPIRQANNIIKLNINTYMTDYIIYMKTFSVNKEKIGHQFCSMA